MADSKVSELTAATTAAGADSLYLVQNSVSKSVTVAKLFGTVATPVQFTDSIQIGDHSTITAAGAINPAYNVTYINDPSGPGACTIGTGLDGQVHIVVMSSNSGGHALTLSGANVCNTITFNGTGDSATLLYDTGLSKWYFIGGSATVS